MAWSYRVVQQPSSRWVCRFGRHLFDEHTDLADAIAHSGLIAAEHRPANLYVHYFDGPVTCIASY